MRTRRRHRRPSPPPSYWDLIYNLYPTTLPFHSALPSSTGCCQGDTPKVTFSQVLASAPPTSNPDPLSGRPASPFVARCSPSLVRSPFFPCILSPPSEVLFQLQCKLQSCLVAAFHPQRDD
ncbi:hypothetical protein AMTR_s00046p00229340, partial [Amborella trichopoda]